MIPRNASSTRGSRETSLTGPVTLNVYGNYIPEDEGGKAAPLAAPARPIEPEPAPAPSNVIPLRRRNAG